MKCRLRCERAKKKCHISLLFHGRKLENETTNREQNRIHISNGQTHSLWLSFSLFYLAVWRRPHDDDNDHRLLTVIWLVYISLSIAAIEWCCYWFLSLIWHHQTSDMVLILVDTQTDAQSRLGFLGLWPKKHTPSSNWISSQWLHSLVLFLLDVCTLWLYCVSLSISAITIQRCVCVCAVP